MQPLSMGESSAFSSLVNTAVFKTQLNKDVIAYFEANFEPF